MVDNPLSLFLHSLQKPAGKPKIRDTVYYSHLAVQHHPHVMICVESDITQFISDCTDPRHETPPAKDNLSHPI